MQIEVDKAKAETAQAKTDLLAAQKIKSDRELDLETQVRQLTADLVDKTAKVDSLSKDLAEGVKTGQASQKKADDAQKKIDDLQDKLKEKTDALAKAQSDLKSATDKLADAKKSGDDADALKKKLADAQKAGGESDPDLDEAYTLLKASMKPLVDADLAYVTRDSRGVVVGLKADYVFQPGSTVVSDQCHVTLDKVAEIFAKYSKEYVEVQGHTDSQPVVNQVFVDNWALASARADNVVRYFADDTKVMSSHLKSSSCSEFRPNDKMPRRVDLILSSHP
jgi:flagellar motor protein MotB